MKIMKTVLLGIGFASMTAQAAELAYTVRPTELKAKPFTDAATVASLAEKSKVDVLLRQSSWLQIKADNATGWVKMLSLRFEEPLGAKKGDSEGLMGVFNVARTGKGSSASTTGVKGFDETKFREAKENPDDLRKLEAMGVSKAEAADFGRLGKLQSQTMDYVDESGRAKK